MSNTPNRGGFVRFIPQAWINDYAVDVDPVGPTVWWVHDQEESEDDIVRSPKAPLWVQNWPGPWRLERPRE